MVDIVISEYIDPAALKRLDTEFDIHYDQDLWRHPDQLAALMHGVPALIVRFQAQVRGIVLDNADAIKCIGRLGVGLDNIDMDTCAARNIEVFPATGANSDSVAELAMGGLYVMFRNAYHVTDDVIAGNWPRPKMMGREVMGKALALVGFGAISKALAWRAKGVGMKVSAWDPCVDSSSSVWAETGVTRYENLLDMVKEADAISIHVPLVDETRDLFDLKMIKQMKSDAVLLNLARGGIVNEADIANALKDEIIAGAFIDAFEVEPLGADSVFKGVPNLFLTPHAGARTFEADDRVCTMIADAVANCLKASA
jgi:(S)-sulfolactate dehydrogenase